MCDYDTLKLKYDHPPFHKYWRAYDMPRALLLVQADSGEHSQGPFPCGPEFNAQRVLRMSISLECKSNCTQFSRS